MSHERIFIVCAVLGMLGSGSAWGAGPDLVCTLAPQPAIGEPAPIWYWFQTIQFQMLVKNVGDVASDWCHVGFYVGATPDDYSTWVDVQDCLPLDPDDETIINIWINFPEGSPT